MIIVCGDFGFIWQGGDKERKMLKTLAKKKYTIAFVDGCHENFDLLESLPVEEWNGGRVHRLGRHIFHLMRGEVFTIEGKKIFAFGGGHSQDFEYRMELDSWWRQERPTKQEIQTAIDHLEARGNKVDYVLTHTPPERVLRRLLDVDSGHAKLKDPNARLLDQFYETVKFKKDQGKMWFSTQVLRICLLRKIR